MSGISLASRAAWRACGRASDRGRNSAFWILDFGLPWCHLSSFVLRLSSKLRSKPMQYGFVIPSRDIQTIPELTAEAEAAGWDGVFIPDCIAIHTPDVPPHPGYDPWIMLAAMAMRTERVRLGTVLTPL